MIGIGMRKRRKNMFYVNFTLPDFIIYTAGVGLISAAGFFGLWFAIWGCG
jgi:hypothetical protein